MAAELHKAAVFEDIVYYEPTIGGATGTNSAVQLSHPVTVHFQTTSFNGSIRFLGQANIPQLLIYCQTTNMPSVYLNNTKVSINTNTTYHFVWDGTEWHYII